MSKRRQVREAVVQFIYAAGSGEILPSADESPALDLLLEPLEERKVRAQSKALLHLQQGRASCLPGLEDLVRRYARVQLTDPGDTSVAPVRELFTAETAFHECLEATQRELNGNKSRATLAGHLAEARTHNQSSRSAAARLLAARPDFPALEQIRELGLALMKDLPRYAERLEETLSDLPGDLPDLAACRKIHEEITATRAAILRYTEAIGTHLAAIDTRIAAAVDNYTPERIDRIDRAILRLATHELLHTPDVPPAVVINEAIELARTFGTTESPRFVNGVLDRIRISAAAEDTESAAGAE